jgi:hypothetical protein
MATIPFFGRAWQLSVDTQDSNHYVARSLVAQDESPLRIAFTVDTYMLLAYWRAEITLYNLAPQGQPLKSGQGQQPNGSNQSGGQSLAFNQRIIAGDAVALSAGYENGLAGAFSADACLLFAGRVFQPVWTRVNVVDSLVKLRCICGLMEDSLNLISFPMAGGATYYDTLNEIGTHAFGLSFSLDADSGSIDKLKQSRYSRAQALHGKPFDLMQDIMRQSTLFSWMTPAAPGSGKPPTISVRNFEEAPEVPDISYGPPGLAGPYTTGGTTSGLVKPTIIGVPEQTQNGVTFKVLMDSDVRIGKVVQLAPGTIINPYEFTPMSNYPPVPSRNGLYIVAGIRYVGDSRGRGDDWYTEVTGVLWDFFPSFIGASSAVI